MITLVSIGDTLQQIFTVISVGALALGSVIAVVKAWADTQQVRANTWKTLQSGTRVEESLDKLKAQQQLLTDEQEELRQWRIATDTTQQAVLRQLEVLNTNVTGLVAAQLDSIGQVNRRVDKLESCLLDYVFKRGDQ